VRKNVSSRKWGHSYEFVQYNNTLLFLGELISSIGILRLKTCLFYVHEIQHNIKHNITRMSDLCMYPTQTDGPAT